MEKDREKPFVPESEPREPGEPREDVRAATSPVRCPYCHADVSPEARDWVVCRKCLARHHAGCWRESGACASCRGNEALDAVAGPRRRRLAFTVALAILASIGFVALALFVAASISYAKHRERMKAIQGDLEAQDRVQAVAREIAKAERARTAQERGKRLFDSIRALMVKCPKWAVETLSSRNELLRSTDVPFHEIGIMWDARASKPNVVVLTAKGAEAMRASPFDAATAFVNVRAGELTIPVADWRLDPVSGKALLFSVDANELTDQKLAEIEAAASGPKK